ncbi:hypothetical protein KSF78_0000022 [Schistosoma japonicum]|nr:hypothetical protein KSF78_0000022 [Schistosoma japonicum]
MNLNGSTLFFSLLHSSTLFFFHVVMCYLIDCTRMNELLNVKYTVFYFYFM